MNMFTKIASAAVLTGALTMTAMTPSQARDGLNTAAAIGFGTGALLGAAVASSANQGYYRDSYAYDRGYAYRRGYAYGPAPVYVAPAPVYVDPYDSYAYQPAPVYRYRTPNAGKSLSNADY